MKGAVGELSNDLVLEIQWLFGVVVEEVDQRLEVSLSFSRCGDQGSESDKSKQFAHRSFGFGKVRISVSVIKSVTTAVPAWDAGSLPRELVQSLFSQTFPDLAVSYPTWFEHNI